MQKKILFILLAIFCIINTFAQEESIQIRRKALDVGVYDYSRAQKNSYKIYYEEEADEKFGEVLMEDERLRNSEIFEGDGIRYFMEQEAYEYCPELNYVMITGGHGFVSAYDLLTLEEIFVNPSTYIYSPSQNYRFGSFEYDGVKHYFEYKKGDKYVSHLIEYTSHEAMSGVYWADDDTIHFLTEKVRGDGSKYHIGYSMQFILEGE